MSQTTGPHTMSFRDGQMVFLFYPETETVTMSTPFKAIHMDFSELDGELKRRIAARLQGGPE